MTASTLHEIQATPVAELAQQPAEALHRLQLDAGDLLAAAKAVVEHIDRAVDLRYADRARQLRLTKSERATVATRLETLDRGRPNNHANLHDFPVTRDDAFGLGYDRDQHAQICAPSLAASPETGDHGHPNKDANWHDLPVRKANMARGGDRPRRADSTFDSARLQNRTEASQAQAAGLLQVSPCSVASAPKALPHGIPELVAAVDPTSARSVEPCLPAAELEAPLYVPAIPLTDSTLCDWIATALPGERLQYHQGLLLLDRSATTSPYPPKERQRIHAVAKRAWLACELDLVHLVSQRVDPFVFRYLAVRTRMTPKASDVRLQLRTPAH
ncbi:MAG: hypothetical protein HT579_03950 [Candidatus Accumulibacter similis]|nr:MAG: hypothetical protein HT579_03950 [Candidatus Accumulibacter similis]